MAAILVQCTLNVAYKKENYLTFLFFTNLILSLPQLSDWQTRYGVDYVAYIQQAGAVYNGERDYAKLSSHLGPCYYPAGHIWHYIPAYWLHLSTESAEVIIKAGHHIIHSITILFVTKIAYQYFDCPDQDYNIKAQIVGAILLCNTNMRTQYSLMYNDEIMVMYVVISIYCSISNRPYSSSLFLTLGLSNKAGVLLIIPAFLGQMQYNHGTKVLMKSVVIVVGF